MRIIAQHVVGDPDAPKDQIIFVPETEEDETIITTLSNIVRTRRVQIWTSSQVRSRYQEGFVIVPDDETT